MPYSLFLGAAVKSAAVLAAIWALTLLMRRSSAAARHLVWTAGFAALLALPLLSIAVPVLRVPVAGTLMATNVLFHTSVTASPVMPPSAGLRNSGAAADVASAESRPNWLWTLLLLWAAGACVALAQMLLGWFAIRQVRRNANAFTSPTLAALQQELGIRDDVDLLESRRGTMPMTCGMLHPTVFMPSESVEWSEERRRMVLMHELAHVRRGDVATHLMARIALSLYWWNPLAWTAWREFLKERERAADDLVLSLGARASDYAAHLLDIARTLQLPRAAGWAVPMARRSQLETRLSAILDSGVNRNATGRSSAWITAAIAVAVIVPLAALRAQNKPEPVPADVEAAIRSASAQHDPEILDSSAKAAMAARRYDVAGQLLESSLAIRAAKSGEQSIEYGLGLLKLAELKSKQHKTAEEDDLYTKALALLGSRPEAAPAFIHLGISAMGKRDFDLAIENLQRAKIADPAKSGYATMWMAIVRQRQNRAEEADALFKEAQALADPTSMEVVTTMQLYAQFLHLQAREDEARSIQDRSRELSKAISSQRTSALPPGGTTMALLGGEATKPAVITKVEPEYTDEARAAELQGTTSLSVEVGTDGFAHNIAVTRALGLGLDEQAVGAVSQWRFKPALKDGRAMAVQANIEVNWRLF